MSEQQHKATLTVFCGDAEHDELRSLYEASLSSLGISLAPVSCPKRKPQNFDKRVNDILKSSAVVAYTPLFKHLADLRANSQVEPPRGVEGAANVSPVPLLPIDHLPSWMRLMARVPGLLLPGTDWLKDCVDKKIKCHRTSSLDGANHVRMTLPATQEGRAASFNTARDMHTWAAGMAQAMFSTRTQSSDALVDDMFDINLMPKFFAMQRWGIVVELPSEGSDTANAAPRAAAVDGSKSAADGFKSAVDGSVGGTSVATATVVPKFTAPANNGGVGATATLSSTVAPLGTAGANAMNGSGQWAATQLLRRSGPEVQKLISQRAVAASELVVTSNNTLLPRRRLLDLCADVLLGLTDNDFGDHFMATNYANAVTVITNKVKQDGPDLFREYSSSSSSSSNSSDVSDVMPGHHTTADAVAWVALFLRNSNEWLRSMHHDDWQFHEEYAPPKQTADADSEPEFRETVEYTMQQNNTRTKWLVDLAVGMRNADPNVHRLAGRKVTAGSPQLKKYRRDVETLRKGGTVDLRDGRSKPLSIPKDLWDRAVDAFLAHKAAANAANTQNRKRKRQEEKASAAALATTSAAALATTSAATSAAALPTSSAAALATTSAATSAAALPTSSAGSDDK